MDFTPYVDLIRDPAALCIDDAPEPSAPPSNALLFVSDISEFPLARIKDRKGVAGQVAAELAKASVDLETDLKAFLAGQFAPRSTYSGLMGHSSYTQLTAVPSGITKLTLPMRYQQGGALLIRSVGQLLSDAVFDHVIGLYAEGSDTALHTTTVQIKAKSTQQFLLDKPWAVPMDGNRYELRSTLPTGVRVGDNNISCGCGSMRGLTDLLAQCCAGKASGFMLTLGSTCSYDPLMVQLMENDRTRKVIAFMLAYQTSYRMLITPASGEIERDTVISADDLKASAEKCRGEYLDRLGWLKTEVTKLNLSAVNTCFSAPKSSWARGGIFKRS